jgi:4-amino-4-deoxy-L-arabinose transferase-like glycosyltransferase
MILILLALISIFLVLSRTEVFSTSVRYNFIITLQIFGLLSLVSVETLSYFNILNATTVRIFWAVILLGSVFFVQSFQVLRDLPKKITALWKQDKLLLSASLMILTLTFFVGLLYAPITYDSLSYHLPRIEFWIQHQNISYYATQTDRNLYQPPLAEYMVLQFRIIDNADYFDFFVQWIFGLGSCVIASLIASLIASDKKTQLIAFFVTATIPMLILQSGTTQNDLIHAFFISAAFLHFLLDIREGRKTTIIWAGLAIGQAILTKGTAYIFLMPICIWWGLNRLVEVYQKRFLFSKLVFQILILVAFFLGNILTFYARNYEYIGSPLGVSKDLYYHYNNQSHSLADMVSVISRNVGLHFGLPGLHKVTEMSLLWFHEHILNQPLNNPATSFTHFDLPLLASTEDTVSCFLHLILIIMTSIYTIRKGNAMSRILLAIIGLSFLVFCYVVKFQIWHIRLHLPIFLLSAPLIAIYLNQFKFKYIAFILLSISGISYAVFTFGRPLIKFPPLTSEIYFMHPRNTHYYTFETEYSKKINSFIQFLEESPYKTIGIKTDDPYGNDALYPIMYELRGKKTFIPVQVTNESKKYQVDSPKPDCVIYFTPYPPYDFLTLNQHDKYHRIPNNAGNLIIFVSNNLKSNK